MPKFASISTFIDRLVSNGRTPGAGLAIAVEGQPVYEHFAGFAREGRPSGPESVWPVASITKLYTAAAIMRLVEQGLLTLNLPVQKVLPEFEGGEYGKITLRQLLTHTSGLPYESPSHEDRLSERAPVDAMTDEAVTLELEFAPGTRQLYSDLGYAVAGRMAARASGQTFEALVRHHLLDQAGLRETWLPAPDSVYSRVAHVEGAVGRTPDTEMYNSAYGLSLAHPAFGAVATLSDLLSFGLLFDPFAAPCFFARASLDVMTTDQTCGDVPGDSVIEPAGIIHPWGIGFMLKGRSSIPELASPGSYGHGGATGCYLWIDPARRATIAFVSNKHYRSDPDDLMPRLDQVLNVVLGELSRE
ncbi:MAG: serine hydrolase domain-containing protein [Thermomicrobiales bacterium]